MPNPSNIWIDSLAAEGWPEGVRGDRLLERSPGTKLVCAVWELDPGADSPNYHTHHATEELVVVLRGTPTLRTPDGERELREGDVAHFPVGAAGAHQVRNRSQDVVRYLMVAAHSGVDLIEYVDERKVIAYSLAQSSLQGERLVVEHELD